MPVTTEKPAPYAPASAIIGLIERHRSKGLPATVDAEALSRSSVPESLIPRTLQALQTLDLIDADGKVTQTMEGLRLASEAEFQPRMVEWLNAAYHDALQFIDPAVDSETRIRDAFRSYVPTGQQPRMVTTFIGLYGAAGVRAERPRPPAPRNSVGRTSGNHRLLPPPKRKQPEQKVPPALPAFSQGQSNQDLPPPLAGLLSSLPRAGQTWTTVERERFVVTFGAVLDFCFPIDDRPKRKEEPENDEEEDRE
ncbi:hypothetical protein EN794_049865 [Mesorhizobium sp. M00.F.Ca.ET.151.01.1.1]|uniref:DUF5343 domain-containing protein n=1 Tax=unclassified Mesorhizobium TaxID=325217 RepID=UPI001092CDCD|nr:MULTISPECIES: DUF5343 domain-containing protein [unclassified Mesorhizobium]TGP98870.1 hypothetical protein EN861_11030 [Mesorhizobium sp. M8A.F.Ca.ET.218.01.1.1]TGT20213.1 hypothetical protein EN856_11040 [Mesorhizobium sp. M8A.F.Ca.ET.213.01.1.1]TGU88090.1 hypothetical protein EN794_049865 [Mesorhizobium sp. M00.F.Ca.ET.151.01.1.1]